MKKLIFIVLLNFLGISSFSQKLENDFRKVCFCSVGVAHPYKVLNLDNNQELLFVFKDGKALKELDSLGVEYTSSQIAMMRLWNLIEKKENKYYTSIPIIYSDETEKIRAKTREYANDLVSLIEKDYSIFLQTLNDNELNNNAFSIFFAFVLDDLVWQKLREDSLVKRNTITKENPFWDGTMWMIQQRREFSCGTNSIGYENYVVSINWSGKLNVKLPDYKLLKLMLKDYKEKGIVVNPEVVEAFKHYKFFNNKGKLRLPFIDTESTNKIYLQSKVISDKVAVYLIENIDYGIVTDNFPSIEKKQAMIIIYHEIMWDVLEIMEKRGSLTKPKTFSDIDNSTIEDLKDLIFIVKY